MQSNRGVYALLLGSGVSKSAGILTGWEIVEDLIAKLADLNGVRNVPNLELWYREEYEAEPEYSTLLQEISKTQAERQQLLLEYFEPTAKDLEEGRKQPTAAHRAVARLVAKGFIRVIITTNFDRLIEKALEDEGVFPQVLSTPDQVKGAVPLVHTKCCVFKIHGDYKDPRILNTPAELSDCPAELKDLLDRILDEFGLIVCGWSAKWDVALRNAIASAESRRFTTFWTFIDEIDDASGRIVKHRDAQAIQIKGADDFFQSVQESVESIEEHSAHHPLSTEASVASLKRFLPNREDQIRLGDLIDATVDQAVRSSSGTQFEVDGMPRATRELVSDRLRAYESVYSILVSLAVVGGYWAEAESSRQWRLVLERLATVPYRSQSDAWTLLRHYPAVIYLYALGLGSIAGERLDFLAHCLHVQMPREPSGMSETPVLHGVLHNMHFGNIRWNNALVGMEKSYAALSDWIHDALRSPVRRVIADDSKYTFVFDTFEILASLASVRLESDDRPRYLPGAFLWRIPNCVRVLNEIRESIQRRGPNSHYVRSGLFGETGEECLAALDKFDEYVTMVRNTRGIGY